jgi:hypothetical protein
VVAKLRRIPAESIQLGTTSGIYFHATIYKTPAETIAAEVTIDPKANQAQLDSDRMNSKIFETAIKVAGKKPDYMSCRRSDG